VTKSALLWLISRLKALSLQRAKHCILLVLACLLSACLTHRAPMTAAMQRDAGKIAAKAVSLTGVPYRLGGNSPAQGFDCSGLVVYVYSSVGIRLPRTTSALMKMHAPSVKQPELFAGDLLYFSTKKYSRQVSHVGIYIGGGQFVHAPSSGKHVSKARLADKYWQANYLGANRPLAARRYAYAVPASVAICETT